MSQRLTRPVTLRLSPRIAIHMKEGELIQLAGLVAILVALATFTLYGDRVEVFLLTVVGIIAIVAPETIDEVHSLIRGRR